MSSGQSVTRSVLIRSSAAGRWAIPCFLLSHLQLASAFFGPRKRLFGPRKRLFGPRKRFCSSLFTGRAAATAALGAAVAVAAWAQPAAHWIIETVAGPGSFSGDGGPAVEAQLRSPQGVAVDAAGNLYIADSSNHRIRKVDAASGDISTVAGDGTEGYGGDGGPATQAQLAFPRGVALDGAGNLYIADLRNHRIRKVDPAGVISTVAGDGALGYGGDGGPAAQAQLRFPQDVAVDAAGNLYIADGLNHRIRKVDPAGVISTTAGDGTRGYGGDGGPAVEAQLRSPQGVAVDAAGNLYIADTSNQSIRKVDPAGVISTVAGDGTFGYGGDGGPAAQARLAFPRGVAVDAAGNLYIADSSDRIRKVDAATSIISTVAGGGTYGYGGDGGPATAARLAFPRGVAVDAAGNLYIADAGNGHIRKVDAASGLISRVAGGEIGDGGPAVEARLSSPQGVAVDGSGNLYIAEGFNQRIRKVDPAGVISTVAGDGTYGYGGDGGPAAQAQLWDPRGLAVDAAGNLYIADRSNDRIRKVDPAGVISTVAGDGAFGYGGDGGPAAQAQLRSPQGVAVDAAGNLYIADTGNNRIRKVDPAGVISTVAGDGARGYGGDGGPATLAQLYSPGSVAVDAAGNLYIADGLNQRIRKVDPAGVISTVAGDGARGYGGDGGPATQAQLQLPYGVAVDAAGNLYIADRSNQRIRKVDPAGVISTVAGDGAYGYGGDGGPAAQAQLAFPEDVAVDAAGNLYIADRNNHRIRKVTPPVFPPGTPLISAGGVVLATGTPVVNRISPNAIVSVFGQDFAPPGTQATSSALDAAGNIATQLAATCLEIDGKRAPLFAVFPTQINAQAPHELTPGRTVAVEVIRGCGGADERRGPAMAVAVAAVSPAFFNVRSNPDGRNPLLALHGGGPALVGAPGLGAEFTPAEPGAYVTLFGTGFGATEPALEAGQIPGGPAALAGEISFTFGGISAAQPDLLTIDTVAGDGTEGYGGDGGPAAQAQLRTPGNVAVDAAGNLYIADTGSHRIRKVTPAGVISTAAGDGTRGYGGDGGPAAQAQLNGPSGVAVDAAGNLYIADRGNHRIRKVDPTGVMTTVAGDGTEGYGGDGGPAALARLNRPTGVAVDGSGNLYIADAWNDRIRKVDAATSIVSTVAGDGMLGYGGDGGPAALAQLRTPGGVAVDAAGNLYIADTGSHRIRKVNPTGVISTAAGDGTEGYGGDGGPAALAQLASPRGVAVDAAGNLYIADWRSNRIRRVTPTPEEGPPAILYAGVAPCCAGFYQFTVRVPPDLPDGDAPVVATVQGVSTPAGPFLTVRRR